MFTIFASSFVITSAVSAAVASPTVSANTAAPDSRMAGWLRAPEHAAGCQPDFVPRAKGKCPARMLDPRPTFTHALEQQARMNRLVEIKDSVIKPLRGE
jgi:hypothetical protein